jgi:hypothetical protein
VAASASHSGRCRALRELEPASHRLQLREHLDRPGRRDSVEGVAVPRITIPSDRETGAVADESRHCIRGTTCAIRLIRM